MRSEGPPRGGAQGAPRGLARAFGNAALQKVLNNISAVVSNIITITIISVTIMMMTIIMIVTSITIICHRPTEGVH